MNAMENRFCGLQADLERSEQFSKIPSRIAYWLTAVHQGMSICGWSRHQLILIYKYLHQIFKGKIENSCADLQIADSII